ncbi:hypothetical protein L6164_004363 [Bauhinia variegata]|uniref:Uncharacterized protein n=1 Tax=Bauhinia variegata TaxID=167791 RepID=A0ACB9Q6W7_BAUVA|nr:hypothetical protein L6164_004363 [Bauhinia variegata]
MASNFTLQCQQLFYYSRSFGLDNRKKTTASALLQSNIHVTEERDCSAWNRLSLVSLSRSRRCSSLAVSTKDSFACTNKSKEENEAVHDATRSQEMEFNRVDHMVWVLHESARSFSQAVESLRLAGSFPQLTMAWLGKDVNEWHRRIAYQVAVYTLLKTSIDVEILLSHERLNEFSPVKETLIPLINPMGELIESQLKMKHPDLVRWFRVSEMPRIAGYFTPLLKKWSMEYAGSGVAGIIVAITCCTAVVKLGSRSRFFPLLVSRLKDVLVKFMDFSLNLASLEKLHQLAIGAGFELDFLSHFGRKILPSEKVEDLEFWIGLAHKKILKALQEESIILNKLNLHYKIQLDSLATLGLFSYLGRRTRIFLSAMGIKDVDEMVKDFLSYLECGTVFVYPEFASIPVYQLFMEVVSDEISWLDFYGSYVQINRREKRSKNHPRQAEKEIILSVVFTVCYDVFSGFAHFNRSTQQPLDAALLSYLLRSQGLLSMCLQDHWAAYDKSLEALLENAASDTPTSFFGSRSGPKLSFAFEAQQNLPDISTEGYAKGNTQNMSILKKAPLPERTDKTSFGPGTWSWIDNLNLPNESFVKRHGIKFLTATTDIWLGTRLLLIDIKLSLVLLMRLVHGNKASRRQRKRIKRTLADIVKLLPVTILMLLPVTAVGHAAMLAAINKYMPCLIPSPYSRERLDVVKQLDRTREMDDQSWGSLEDP